MIAVIIYTLCFLAILVGIVLIAPIRFDLEGELGESLSFKGRVGVGWAGGIFSFNLIHQPGETQGELGILGFKKLIFPKPGKENKPSPDNKKDKDDPKRRRKSKGSLTAFLNLEFFKAVKKGVHKLVRALHLKINLSGVYGFDDPALTGIVLGWIYALNIKNYSINLNPDFTEEVIDLKGSLQGWLIPLQIILTAIGILLMKPVRAIWWPRIKFGKKPKEDVKYA
ncbi:MAG: DUF2953 domain-containing protein [Syntrophomonadaceae bacterium]|nr:DUF2953 domain-containing protein [Syntrophomonadaceae bacterium]